LWDDQWGYPIFATTMSLQRFTNIMRALRFDDKSTRTERISTSGNQAAAVQDIFDLFLAKCRSSYYCGPSVTIDEQLISFHGRCRFRMYIPSKPGKYGLKLWIMADSDSYYCADAQLYAGKVGNQPDVGQATRVVLELAASIRGSGRNITTDNFFTSYKLSRDLMERRLTLVGTMRSNRKEIPSQMLPNGDRSVYSSTFGFSRDGTTLVSYVPKRRKAVVLLSTQHRDDTVADDEKAKPEIITYYNATKSGVDVLDKLVRTYTCKRPSKRWTVCFFWNMIDIAAYNAFVLWITANPTWNSGKSHVRRLYLRELGKQLLAEHVSARLAQPQGKRRRIQESSIRAGMLPVADQSADNDDPGANVRRRCRLCPRKKEMKTPKRCDVCKSHVCRQHSVTLSTCPDCVNLSRRVPALPSSASTC